MEDEIWKQDVLFALCSENRFIGEQPPAADSSLANDLKPTQAETERAVANIRSWRSYLPAGCVAKLIDEGWQWST